jgi:hypothetical protein
MNGAAMTVPARKPLEDQDPILLELLRLAAEVILAHPEAVPDTLYELCDSWADELHIIVSAPAPGTRSPGTGKTPAADGQPPQTAVTPGTTRTAGRQSTAAG